ncbi:MAG: hypothetical protein AB7G06_08095 [Bdellovibrionales bacterium]
MDLDHLWQSQMCVYICPGNVNSSANGEAIAALALKMPGIFFVKDTSDLVFMLRHAEKAKNADVTMVLYSDETQIADAIAAGRFDDIFAGRTRRLAGQVDLRL